MIMMQGGLSVMQVKTQGFSATGGLIEDKGYAKAHDTVQGVQKKVALQLPNRPGTIDIVLMPKGK